MLVPHTGVIASGWTQSQSLNLEGEWTSLSCGVRKFSRSRRRRTNQLQLILQLFRTLLEFYKRRTVTRKDFYKPHLAQMMAKCIKFVNAEVEADHQNMEENTTTTTTMTTTSSSTSSCSSSAYSSILQATLLL